MLKQWKIFSLGLLVAALGLLVASCVDTEPTDEDYTVTLYSGTGYYDAAGKWVIETDERAKRPGATGDGTYEEGEDVVIYAGTAPAGYKFLQWTSSPALGSALVGRDSAIASFEMPGNDVKLTAWFEKTTVVTTYPVTVVGGTADDDEYEAGETVTITATIIGDSLFVKWIADSSVTFIAGTTNKSQVAKFRMPASAVTVTSVLAPLPDDDQTAVRFTWELKEQSKIQSIAANDVDVKAWFEDVYMAEDYIEEDATAVPLYKGSPDVPLNIYSSTLHSVTGSPYKSKYFAISTENDDDGKYTAVCTVDDPEYDNIADIVANYDVSDAGDDNIFFEIAFDVGTFLAGEDDLGWFRQPNDNPQIDPRLEKPKVKKLVKKLNKGYVTYYILHRPRK